MLHWIIATHRCECACTLNITRGACLVRDANDVAILSARFQLHSLRPTAQELLTTLSRLQHSTVQYRTAIQSEQNRRGSWPSQPKRGLRGWVRCDTIGSLFTKDPHGYDTYSTRPLPSAPLKCILRRVRWNQMRPARRIWLAERATCHLWKRARYMETLLFSWDHMRRPPYISKHSAVNSKTWVMAWCCIF